MSVLTRKLGSALCVALSFFSILLPISTPSFATTVPEIITTIVPAPTVFLETNLTFPWNFLLFLSQTLVPWKTLFPAGLSLTPAEANTHQDFASRLSFFPSEPTELSVWMLSPSSEVFFPLLENLQKTHRNIVFHTTAFADEATYFAELNKAFSRGTAPDIFLVNDEWFRKLQIQKYLSSAPLNTLATTDIQNDFFPIALDFTSGVNVFAAPLFGKFPVMFSNTALLTDDRIFLAEKPGQKWSELFTNLQKYAEFGPKNIVPVSLGNPEFAPFSFDIFLLLLKQANVSDFLSKEAEDAFSFLLKFAALTATRTTPTEELEFVQGKIAIMFGDAETLARLKNLLNKVKKISATTLTNDRLQLNLIPQLHTESPKTIGTIWGLAVSAKTPTADFAWSLVRTLTDTPEAQAHFLKTGLTPLRKNIALDIFSDSAALAETGGLWQNLDFAALFRENVRAQFPTKKNQLVPTLAETMQKFADFFSLQ